MSISRATARASVARRLGDTSLANYWTAAEINFYLQEGYDLLNRATGMLWVKSAPAGLQEVAGTGTYTLPTDLYEIERLTWKKRRMLPVYPEELLYIDPAWRTTQGEPYCYVRDGDGIGTIRYVRVPSASGSNISIEYTRRGLALSDAQNFEIPDRYVDYVEWFALWRALERDGPGQDTEFAMHWRDRFNDGVERIKRRKRQFLRQRVGRMGGRTDEPGKRPFPRLPWQYGR